MGAELVAAVALGSLVLWAILSPLVTAPAGPPAFLEPLDPEETRRGIALIALKEIDFDRATGKLSDQDYQTLKSRYTAEALAALREDESGADAVEMLIAERVKQIEASGAGGAPVCPACGPRPEPGARFCSNCGGPVTSVSSCRVCHSPLEPSSRYCPACGVPTESDVSARSAPSAN
jgi:Double zinc ribbon